MTLYLEMFVLEERKRDRNIYENTQKPQFVAAFHLSSKFVTRVSKGAQHTDSTCSKIKNVDMTPRLSAPNSQFSKIPFLRKK